MMYKLFFLILFPTLTFAQKAEFDLTIHNRVDTSKEEVKEIITLWKNYLSSKPDSIYNNPYWNEDEKEMYEDFDFTRQFLYRMPSEKLLKYFSPTVLSIVKKHGAYAIRTLFYADKAAGKTKNSNPWAITEIYAIKENNQWKLKNALPIITRNWNQKTTDKITFIYPPAHQFNDSLAKQANSFCNKLTNKFQLPNWEPFDFYITSKPDKMGRLLGFDFFFVGYATGMSWKRERMLFTGKGSEWYPHEFVHLILPEKNRHFMIEEGFATWQGGSRGKTFKENAAILARKLNQKDTITFNDILTRKWGRKYNALYTTGAIICREVWMKEGAKGIHRLLNIPPDNENLVTNLCDIFEVDKSQLTTLLKEDILNTYQ